MSTIIFQIQSVLIVCLLTYGIYQRKNLPVHKKIMIFSIIWDILLVLQIELNRSAINTALKMTTNSMLMNFHVTIAVSTVVFYFILLYSGYKLSINRKSKIRAFHKSLGILTYLFRLSTLITSFIIKTS